MENGGGVVMTTSSMFVLGNGTWVVGSNGLSVRDGAQPTYDEWRACGDVLTRFYSVAKWAIGDWLLFGEHHYESWTQAADELGYDPKTVQNYVRVAERFPPASRTLLSWHHHLRVAALEPEVAADWLARATEARWSCAELSAAMRNDHAVSTTLLSALERVVAVLDRVVQQHPDQAFVAEHVTPHLMGLASAAQRLRNGGH